ncbi:hypothetical protein NHH03_14100 [Stieleria sp. TO1_6]|uniref:hypothetical protein n=1 Tax=Stieleria tagensis TaxID=2956795 RepID=UPI00209AE644|nr:hypothetical protein [Stieleria tagensis]MCO8122876.1 hypothetical protein [Stieleria tagensis]
MKNAIHLLPVPALIGLLLCFSGCLKKSETPLRPVFETQSLDSCLAIGIDLSGSFADDLTKRAYPLILGMMADFTDQSFGGDCKIVLSQMSGNDDVLLFEGTPEELRHRFRSPEEMSGFLKAHSKPDRSPVYVATRTTIDYINAMPDVAADTKVVTVLLSDMRDSESNLPTKSKEGYRMIDSLTHYRERGGNLALYFVANDEVSRWKTILERSGFEPGQFVINNALVTSPELPRF